MTEIENSLFGNMSYAEYVENLLDKPNNDYIEKKRKENASTQPEIKIVDNEVKVDEPKPSTTEMPPPQKKSFMGYCMENWMLIGMMTLVVLVIYKMKK